MIVAALRVTIFASIRMTPWNVVTFCRASLGDESR
jgi:hypothetical protein